MTQQANALTTKLDNSTLISGTFMVEGENQFLQDVLQMPHMRCVCPHLYTGTQKHKSLFMVQGLER